MPQPWQDTSLSAEDRAAALLSSMTLEEKLAQLAGAWPGSEAEEGEDVAPLQHEVSEAVDLDGLLPHGIGQLTRPFGTSPVEPAEGAAALARLQARIAAGNRFGIPALAHEECLTGFFAWRATVFPTPLAWGASFDPALVGRAAGLIGGSLRSAGIHQGLAPVLDVVRDARWGRTEESIGEDPYLVATIGTAYVRGLESAGIVATLKHFAGYAASRGGRNHAPVSIGPRELADVVLPPFELAVRDGGARSVMHSYNDVDGVPSAANPWLLTELLRDTWGFTGTVVADYFGVSFLELAHRVADTRGGAAGLALAAGVDVELPAVRCFGTPLRDAVRAGEVDEALVDRAALRVLRQKCELGLLDPDWSPMPSALAGLWTPREPPTSTSTTTSISTSIRRRCGPSRGSSPRSRWCCSPTTAMCCRSRRTPGSRWSARSPTTRPPCSAATPSPATSGWSTPDCPWASRCRRSSPRCAPSCPVRGSPMPRGAPRPAPPRPPVTRGRGLGRCGGAHRREPAGAGGQGGGGRGCVHRGAGRPLGPVRPGHLGRGLRRRRPRTPR
ncbi:hypothetical protein SVIO_040670 [Streptomyces violaceusniger]|uniref:Glycoside hydrolase family 3 N-terminal domain-containing protein n=1 Tax=Streptomyces violaceusniger TaxID=68280 RepID=A0A4D4KZ30_STRVO|nr:hypothetical protein SVIO_040670 [Streptomyces violaceusniger]